MFAIAGRLASGGLATAEEDFAVFRGRVLHGSEIAAFMGTVAERLLLAFPAATPEVIFSCLNFDRVGGFFRAIWFAHLHLREKEFVRVTEPVVFTARSNVDQALQR